jgi:uracil-DNA glycosylase family 4
MEPVIRGTEFLVVGEAPSHMEDKKGKWLSGESGDYLKAILKANGITDYIYTGHLICSPIGVKDKDLPKLIEYCRPNVMNLIKEHKPKVVILLGGLSIRSLIAGIWKKDIGEASKWTGWTIPLLKHNCWIVPTYSNRDVIMDDKNVVMKLLFERQIEQAKALTKRPMDEITNMRAKLKKWESRIEILNKGSDILDAIEYFNSQKMVAFDYEATAAKPEYKGSNIVSVSFSNLKRTVAFMWPAGNPMVRKAFIRFLTNPKVGKIASNLKYEDRMSRYEFGVEVRGWAYDTMLGAHHIDCRTGVTGLKFQSFVNFGILSYDDPISAFLGTEEGKGKINRIMEEVETTQLLEYNAKDSLYEFILAVKQTKQNGLYQKIFKGGR